MAYASELTKEDLIKMGVVDIDFDTLTVYGANGPLAYHQKHKQGYILVYLYNLDENGNKIKIPIERCINKNDNISYIDTYVYQLKSITLSRVFWAWKYGIAHKGKVIDHINNKHDKLEDYRLDNLQEIWPWENIAKERPKSDTRIVHRKRKSISYYEDKLVQAEIAYENAKLKGDADLVHKTRSMVSYFRACIRGILEKMGQNEQYVLQKD